MKSKRLKGLVAVLVVTTLVLGVLVCTGRNGKLMTTDTMLKKADTLTIEEMQGLFLNETRAKQDVGKFIKINVATVSDFSEEAVVFKVVVFDNTYSRTYPTSLKIEAMFSDKDDLLNIERGKGYSIVGYVDKVKSEKKEDSYYPEITMIMKNAHIYDSFFDINKKAYEVYVSENNIPDEETTLERDPNIIPTI